MDNVIKFLQQFSKYQVSVDGKPEQTCLFIRTVSKQLSQGEGGFYIFVDFFTAKGDFGGRFFGEPRIISQTENAIELYDEYNHIVKITGLGKFVEPDTYWYTKNGLANLIGDELLDKEQSVCIDGVQYNVLDFSRIKNQRVAFGSTEIKELKQALHFENYCDITKTLYYIKKSDGIYCGIWDYVNRKPVGKHECKIAP